MDFITEIMLKSHIFAQNFGGWFICFDSTEKKIVVAKPTFLFQVPLVWLFGSDECLTDSFHSSTNDPNFFSNKPNMLNVKAPLNDKDRENLVS